jgi:glycosyltransferase involved in cell wall biosynthesis
VRLAVGDEDGWVIPCGIDLDAFRPVARNEARQKLGLPTDKRLILFAGDHWRPEKRFDLLEAALPLVQRELPDTELILLTKQAHGVVPLYMSACDVLVLTSALEGSPMVIKEAMACNLPIVSVRVGDVPQVIGSTPGCALAEREPADIADKLVQALRKLRRTDGRARISHLSHDRIARRVLEVYRQTVRVKKEEVPRVATPES